MLSSGDKVKCIDFYGASGRHLDDYVKEHGNEFTIVELYTASGTNFYQVKEMGNQSFLSSRFVKKENE